MNRRLNQRGLNRRDFLGLSAMGLTGLTILPSFTVKGMRIAPSDRVVMGFIGLGRQGLSDFRSFSGAPGLQVVACCDVDSIKRLRFKKRVEEWQISLGLAPRCDQYERYEELLERTDIDAVEVATPDHWHSIISIDACQAGKDVYVQKPMAFTIQEGLKMVRAVRDNKRVLQVGCQQRSSAEFQKAIELVQTGAIGHIEKIYAKVGDPPRPLDLPEMPVPPNLNWNLWLGPLNDSKIHYHPDLCPPVTLEPEQNETLWGAWRWYIETGNGYTSDWGAHHFDIAQAAIGMDGSGPSEIIPKGYKGQAYLTFKYLNGIVMTEQPYLEDVPNSRGIKFFGTKGWIEVARGYLACSNPKLIPADIAGTRPQPPSTQTQQSTQQAPQTTQQTRQSAQTQQAATQATQQPRTASPHMQNFIDCVRSRKNPIAPVEVGCSTNTLCCLGNMATELGRPVRWNPATLEFVDDQEAASHRRNQYAYRPPYKL